MTWFKIGKTKQPILIITVRNVLIGILSVIQTKLNISYHLHNNTPLKKKCFSTGRFVLPWLFTTLRVMAIAYKCDMRCIMETQRVNVWVSAHQTFDHTVYLLNVAWFSMSTTEQKTQNPIVFWLKHVHLIWDNIWILRMSVAVVNV